MGQEYRLGTTAKRIFYVGIYKRKSTEEDDSRSVHNQEVVLRNALDRIMEADDINEYIFVDAYCDENYTGTDSERPDFKRLLRDVAANRINMLLVTELSRLSRNISESLYYVQSMFVTLDIRFISLQLPAIDSYLNPDGIYNLEIPMQSVMNESHCMCTSLAIRRTFKMLREKGDFIGAFCGYGFKKHPEDRHKLILDEEPVRVMNMIKNWLFEGKTPANIFRMLNDLGIPNPTGYKAQQGSKYSPSCDNPCYLWSAQTVRYVMSREALIGVMVQGKYRVISYKIHKQITTPKEEWYRVEGVIPRIFSDEEFSKIQECLNRTTRSSPNGTKKEVALFAGFLKCADCGKTVSLKTAKGIRYYVCSTYKNYKSCTKHTIREDKLIKAVLAAIQQQIAVAIELQDLVQQLDKAPIIANQRNCFETMVKSKQKELTKIAVYKRSLYQDWKDGEITQEEYRSMKLEFTEQEKQIQKVISNLANEIAKIEKTTGSDNPFITNFLKHQNIQTLTRDLLIDLVDHIDIHEQSAITIHFKFADEYKHMLACLDDSSRLPA